MSSLSSSTGPQDPVISLLGSRDGYGNTYLHYATSKSHKEAIVDLLVAGARTDIANYEGLTALQLAIHQGDASLLKLVLGNAFAINEVHGASPHHLAAFLGDEAALQELPATIEQDYCGATTLHVAPLSGNVDVIMEGMCKSQPATWWRMADTRSRDWGTPLFTAAMVGMDALIAALDPNGEQLDEVRSAGCWTPLGLALFNGQRQTALEMLRRRYANSSSSKCAALIGPSQLYSPHRSDTVSESDAKLNEDPVPNEKEQQLVEAFLKSVTMADIQRQDLSSSANKAAVPSSRRRRNIFCCFSGS
ncbi:Hypothetical protein D9617_39g039390 [Elsinoe fawcettii]|nr:Hypothetical protein D9617_39g039390 [Elsinoe fawcettii]